MSAIQHHAVSCILHYGGKILLLRRSHRVRTNPGRWSTVAGEVEPGRDPLAVAYDEIREETGMTRSQFRFIRSGLPIEVQPTGRGITLVHPFLFHTTTKNVRLNEEHTGHIWIRPDRLKAYRTVPRFRDLLTSVGVLAPTQRKPAQE